MSFQGPLPTVDAASLLQRASIDAITSVLPRSEYRFRAELVDDYGVDGEIELFAQGRATNIRAQVQLKARSNTQVNQAGVVTVSGIETANLNYLLNGLCPLYILYRPETAELRFAFARDEWARLEREGVEWREQKTITIHFRRVLTPGSLMELRERVAEEARIRREVAQGLEAMNPGTGRVVVDVQSLAVTTSREICDALGTFGQMLTQAGRATWVVEQSRLVDTRALLASPRAALAAAHAQYYLSRYYDASASIRQLLLSNPALAPEDRSFLDALHFSVRFLLGELDRAQYDRAIDCWIASAPPSLALQYEIARAWALYTEVMRTSLNETGHAQARARIRECLERGRQIGGQWLLDRVELYELTLVAHEVSDLSLDAAALREMTGDALVAREAQRVAQQATIEWENRLTGFADRTRSTNLLVHCEACLLRNHVTLQAERQRICAASRDGAQPRGTGDAVIETTRQTLELARALEDRGMELTAMIALAETLDTYGSTDEATDLANQALRTAELSGCALQARQADQFLTGGDRFGDRLRFISERSTWSEADWLRAAGDDELTNLANLVVQARGLPERRVPNMLFSLQCQQQLGRDRHTWCKHISLAEFQPNSEIMLYADRPPMRIVCTKRNLAAPARSSNPEEISAEFRNMHCVRCPHRDPGARPEGWTCGSVDRQARTERNRRKAQRRVRRRRR